MQTEKYVKLLDSIPRSELTRLWCELKAQKWPEELGAKPDEASRGKVEGKVLKEIEAKVGYKQCFRELFRKSGWPDQDIEDLWDNSIKKRLDEFYHKLNSQPQRLGKKSAAESGKDGNCPIVSKLLSFLFGILGGLLVHLFFL